MNFWEILFLFFAFQAFLFSLFFFIKRKGDKVSNSILGVYLLLFGCNIIYNVLYWSKLIFTPEYIHFFGLLTNLWLLYPPLIYLYTRRVVEQKKFSLKDTVHLIPLLISIVFHFRFYVLSASEKLTVMSNGTLGDYVINLKYNFIVVMFLMIFYTILTYVSFKKSTLGRNKTRWLRWLLGSFACYVFAMTTYFILSRLGLIHTGHDYFITYTLVFFIALVAYFGFVQPTIFDGKSMDAVLPFKKYQNTGLTQAHSNELKDNLLQYMKTEKPYLESNLRLNDLARQLNLSRHHTSQIINEHFDTNFFDFINTYRIEEAKNLLSENDDLNITDIIYSSGFNNRASFYKTFKKHTSMTPREFNERHNTNS